MPNVSDFDARHQQKKLALWDYLEVKVSLRVASN